MAWNGSNQSSQLANQSTNRRIEKSTNQTIKQSNHPTILRGLLAGLLVVALGGAAVWYFLGGRGATRPTGAGRDRARPSQIATISPQIATNRPAAAESAPQPLPRERPPQRVGEVRDGKLLMLSGELRKVKGVMTSCVQTVSMAEKTFKRVGNRRIASLMSVTPGEGMLGSSEELYENFKEQFEESLQEEIEFSPDDTDEQRELKQAVLDTRKELLACQARGEDVAKVMTDTRNQLQELGTYRDELEKQVEKLKEDGNLSEEDEEDLVKAANAMLEDRGVKPFELPSVIRHALKMEQLQEEGGTNDE